MHLKHGCVSNNLFFWIEKFFFSRWRFIFKSWNILCFVVCCVANYVLYYKRCNTEIPANHSNAYSISFTRYLNLRSLIHNTISSKVLNIYSFLFLEWIGTFWMKKSRWGDPLEEDCLDIDRSTQKYAGTLYYIIYIQT